MDYDSQTGFGDGLLPVLIFLIVGLLIGAAIYLKCG